MTVVFLENEFCDKYKEENFFSFLVNNEDVLFVCVSKDVLEKNKECFHKWQENLNLNIKHSFHLLEDFRKNYDGLLHLN